MVVIPEERFIQRDSSSGYFFPFPLLATTTGHQQQGDEKLEQIRMVQDLYVVVNLSHHQQFSFILRSWFSF